MDWYDGGYQKKLDDLIDAAIRQQESRCSDDDNGLGWTAADTRDTRRQAVGGAGARDVGNTSGGSWNGFSEETMQHGSRGYGRHEKAYWEAKQQAPPGGYASVASVSPMGARPHVHDPPSPARGAGGMDVVRRELEREKRRAQLDRARKEEDKKARNVLWQKVLYNRQNDPSAPHRLLQQHRLSNKGYMQPLPVTSPPSATKRKQPQPQPQPQQPPSVATHAQEATPRATTPTAAGTGGGSVFSASPSHSTRRPASQNGRIRPDVLCEDRSVPYHHRLVQSPRQSPPRPDPAWLVSQPSQVDYTHLDSKVSAHASRVPGWLADPPPF